MRPRSTGVQKIRDQERTRLQRSHGHCDGVATDCLARERRKPQRPNHVGIAVAKFASCHPRAVRGRIKLFCQTCGRRVVERKELVRLRGEGPSEHDGEYVLFIEEAESP